jgi:hypothetical protein
VSSDDPLILPLLLTQAVVFHILEFIFMWFTLPETKGRSIEELEELFLQKNPVKASLQKKNVVVRKGEGVKMTEE